MPEEKGVGKMLIILVLLLIYAISKWIMWRIYLHAVLLYYAERGIELPDTNEIREYSMKVIQKKH